ncbi:MAG: hypothetical protein ABI402_08255 [Ferruginibacter sp.]
MNSIQKNRSAIIPDFINTNGNQKNRTLSANEGRNSSNDPKLHVSDTKKKINRFFAGLPFHPEP